MWRYDRIGAGDCVTVEESGWPCSPDGSEHAAKSNVATITKGKRLALRHIVER
jgi:hypothetical protein